MARLPQDDLNHVLEGVSGWDELAGASLFITGGTGFFGKWLLESFLQANDRLDLRARVAVLSRNPATFAFEAPHICADPAVQLYEGDVRHFEDPPGRFSHVIHAAADTRIQAWNEDPEPLLDTVVQGTRRTLDFAIRSGAKKFLLTSSGAVYGPQPLDLERVPEDYGGGPDPLVSGSSYGEGKRLAELLCSLYARRHSLQTKIARCFAFVGPHLALDGHFAIGNFLRDALAGGPIRVTGDGTPRRSYLYAADLIVWLWTILFRGAPARAYNVGSDEPLAIREVAEAVANLLSPPADVRLSETPTPGAKASRYVPCVDRARKELALEVSLSFQDSIRRSFDWYNETQLLRKSDRGMG